METVLLTGPKHAGKTSVGRALAVFFSGSFTDLDEHIHARAGKSPRALYTEGPGVFRKAEAGALADLLNRREGGSGAFAVIAAGGGIIDNPEALAVCEKAGAIPVYLEVSAETAWERIRRAAETEGLPPFLQTSNPRETHRLLHERRAAAYRAWARVTVRGEGKSPEEIAGEIYKIFQDRGGG
ncbi:MAG: shikimate kinase [Treponema sp.]|jgi:shikimate kinase|nr:shikimate kinase [Treponema sp.]